ncbi:hypothetical protein BW14_06950 [Bifidobacterium sp. UTBIF-68]|uniref:hypothetical protein n=1 Tax=Bifidobacterium sp. UTBIF-68 TaxID=1465262 RepID=UPI00112E5C0F|nr:hypothetical protein [Bifidobacterium sp. UTBIF-68]TPF92895.1 hypothetical protein BW14_06950 [Bifidobacterium sp. UTBIF-68]
MRAEGHTGWTGATVRDILDLKRDVTLSEAQTLSVLLGVTIDMLLNGGQSLHGVGKPVHGVLNADGTLTIRVA